ncbi:MAG: antitoxin family protein [Chloroherpetonaceae bacterium]
MEFEEVGCSCLNSYEALSLIAIREGFYLQALLSTFAHNLTEQLMTKTLEAIYDGEDLKLTEPLNLPPNTKVKITIDVLSDIEVNEKRKALFDALEKTQGI